ncbi:MAG: oligopeptide transporter, OPT family [Candidatus Eisenbacteria sp.]|nr:oligopeptide transporter, OPT family [Candidatus Eisenbacteria bacterium]
MERAASVQVPDPRGPRHSSGEDLREVTIVALLLGGILSIVMGAANAYLGLYAGMTVSASIPAAVVSMALLRGVLRRGSILENNIVQTMASTGESLAAGVIFTVPALVMVGAWQEFRFWPTTLIVMLGGLLGIIFMIPMRRALIVQRPDLVYPEGVACAEVLHAGEQGGGGIRAVVVGLVVGGVFKALLSGVHLIRETVEGAVAWGQRVFYVGADMSVALLAVGYIVDLHIAGLITLGGVIGWVIALPLLGGVEPGLSPLDTAWELWETQVRYIGVGAMLVGGLHSIWNVRRGLLAGVVSLRGVGGGRDPGTGSRSGPGAGSGAGPGWEPESAAGETAAAPGPGSLPGQAVLRTERNMSFPWLVGIFIVTVLATLLFYDHLIGNTAIATLTTVIMIIAAFLFVAVATYIAGLVGSSNSPVSGMTICALLIAAGVLLALGVRGDSAILATLGVAGVVCCATCTSGDVAQDLKTGLLVGATPAKQQWTEIVAAVIPAFCFAPILTLLHQAYGIGTGEPGSLRAPQAALFASLTEGFFGDGDLPWNLVFIGAAIGVALIVIDRFLARARSSFRAHVMPVAVGIYLPLSLDIPILIGGLLRFGMRRRVRARAVAGGTTASEGGGHGAGVLFGSGLIAGEAIIGILLAIPIIMCPDLLPRWGAPGFVSLLLLGTVVAIYARMARR